MIKKLAVLLVIIPSLAFAVAPDAPTNVAPNMNPNWVLDETFPFRVYGPNGGGWITEIALGNMLMAASPWYDAPANEINWGSPLLCCDGPVNSGKLYCAMTDGLANMRLVERDYTTGVARIFLDRYGAYTGGSEDVLAGAPFYNSYDDSVYLMNQFCIRKIVDDEDGTYSVSVIAGDCETNGHVDDTGTSARFDIISGATADGVGNIFVTDMGSSTYVRKIDVNGVVTTLNGSITRDDGASVPLSSLSPNAKYWYNSLSPGRTTGQIHIADSGNNTSTGWSMQRMNTSTYAMTRIQGVNWTNDVYKRRYTATNPYGTEKDGPSLTHSWLNASGRGGRYSPFYDTIFLSGQDNSTIQMHSYVTDWTTAVAHVTRPWINEPTYTDEELQAGGYPTEYNPLNSNTRIPQVIGTDRYGGIYYSMAGDIKLVFRMYNPTLGGLSIEDIP